VFEPNISLAIRNKGDSPLRNPQVKINGGPMWLTQEELLGDIISDTMTDTEKARALYEFHIRQRCHAGRGIPYLNPLRFYQGFGSSICSNDALIMETLWHGAGLKTCPVAVFAHCVSQVFYDDGWHVMDGDLNGLYLGYDNQTVMGEPELAKDHYLVKRTHNYGIRCFDASSPQRDERRHDELAASLYGREDFKELSPRNVPFRNLNYTLRPDEEIVFLWKNRGKPGFYNPKRLYSRSLYHGMLRYKPERFDLFLQHGATQQHNVFYSTDTLSLQSEIQGEASQFVIPVKTIYPVVGGTLKFRSQNFSESNAITISIASSKDGPWETFFHTRQSLKDKRFLVNLHSAIRKIELARRHDLFIKFIWNENVIGKPIIISELELTLDLQMSPLGMPVLMTGKNKITYRAQDEGSIKITHKWQESRENKPPHPPSKPVFPKNGASIQSLKFTFDWEEPGDPDGDSIVDYWIVVSEDSSFRWPISSNFNKIISRTGNTGTHTYTIPFEGLLNPGQKYYWRVRALDNKDAWSEWSDTWTFTPNGPGRPDDLRFKVQDNTITLHWKPPTTGTRPHHYEIFGSNEKGFTPSPGEHEIFGFEPVGIDELVLKKSRVDRYDVHGDLITVPGNFVTTTTNTTCRIVGPDLDTTVGYNRCYYRVQAVDDNGTKSGCTGQIELPYPFVYSTHSPEIVRGKQGEYRVRSLYSLGPVLAGSPGYTLRLRRAKPLKFQIEGPVQGFTIDKHSGVISSMVPSTFEDDTLPIKVRVTQGKKLSVNTIKFHIK
jgi:hypothetical protein